MKRIVTYGALVCMVLGGALMVYGVIIYPTKQPYRDAKAAYQTVYNDNVSFTQKGMGMNAAKATETAFAASLKDTRATLETLKADTKKLGDQPVLKDGEGKDKYQAFSKQLDAYAVYNVAILDSIETLRPVLVECNLAMASQSKASVTALQDCSKNLQNFSDNTKKVPSDDYRVMAKSFAGIYNSLAQAATDDAREQLVNELGTASNEFSKNLSISRAKVDITATAKALDDYLSAKARLFF